MVKNLLAMQETQVQFLGWEDTLEKEMAIYSSILAWRIPWTEEPGRLYIVHGVEKIQAQLSDCHSLTCLKGGNPLCFENSRTSLRIRK